MNRPLAQYLASPPPVHQPRHLQATQPQQLTRRLDEVTVARLVERYQAGETATALATEYDVSKTALLELLRSSGVMLRRQPLSAARVEHARRLRAQGLLYREIGERLGVHKDTVPRALLGL